MPFILGIITARGGSKGITDKNIHDVAGKPLIAWTIAAGQKSAKLNDLILSTDSQKIVDIAAHFGLKTLDLRPAHLAEDATKSIDVLKYEIEKYEKLHDKKIDVIVLLQPTTPLRVTDDIDTAIDIFTNKNADSLISVYDANGVHPSTMYWEDGDWLKPLFEVHTAVRRQDMPKVLLRNGAIYIARRSQIMDNNTIVGDRPAFYEMPASLSVNIDEPFDLEMADWLLRKRQNENPES